MNSASIQVGMNSMFIYIDHNHALHASDSGAGGAREEAEADGPWSHTFFGCGG